MVLNDLKPLGKYKFGGEDKDGFKLNPSLSSPQNCIFTPLQPPPLHA